MRTALSLVQAFTSRVGVPTPSFGFASTDPQVRQIFALLEEAIEEIRTRGSWNELVREATFTSTPIIDQGPVTSIATQGFDRILNDTIYDRTQDRKIYGPLRADQWQELQANLSAGPVLKYRIRGGHLLLDPAPTTNLLLAFEYVSRYCILDQDGVTWKEFITSDQDTVLFPDIIVLSALRWKWKYEKGLDYAEDFRRFETMISSSLSNNGTKPTVVLDDYQPETRPGIFVPEGNWNLS